MFLTPKQPPFATAVFYLPAAYTKPPALPFRRDHFAYKTTVATTAYRSQRAAHNHTVAFGAHICHRSNLARIKTATYRGQRTAHNYTVAFGAHICRRNNLARLKSVPPTTT